MDVTGADEARDRMLVARMQRPGRGNAIDGQTASSSPLDCALDIVAVSEEVHESSSELPGEGHPSSEDPQR
jgi:hypothetical protein